MFLSAQKVKRENLVFQIIACEHKSPQATGTRFNIFIWVIYMCCKGIWHPLSADRGVSIITFIVQYAQDVKTNNKEYLTSACTVKIRQEHEVQAEKREGFEQERCGETWTTFFWKMKSSIHEINI